MSSPGGRVCSPSLVAVVLYQSVFYDAAVYHYPLVLCWLNWQILLCVHFVPGNYTEPLRTHLVYIYRLPGTWYDMGFAASTRYPSGRECKDWLVVHTNAPTVLTFPSRCSVWVGVGGWVFSLLRGVFLRMWVTLR